MMLWLPKVFSASATRSELRQRPRWRCALVRGAVALHATKAHWDEWLATTRKAEAHTLTSFNNKPQVKLQQSDTHASYSLCGFCAF